jgi:hypothetical protein
MSFLMRLTKPIDCVTSVLLWLEEYFELGRRHIILIVISRVWNFSKNLAKISFSVFDTICSRMNNKTIIPLHHMTL